jgi:light-regulated signal transduction histidine kinase (bacteriophytochrome)
MLTFDYGQCEKEDLVHSGKIQGHGVLVGVDSEGVVRYASGNTELISDKPPKIWLGQPIVQCLTSEEVSFLQRYRPEKKAPQSLALARCYNKQAYELVIHTSGDITILEWETTSDYTAVSNTMLSALDNIEYSYDSVIESVLRVASFDRVLIYRFEDDGTGLVVAERNIGCEENLLGLRYPKTDIPQIARDLFMIQQTRLIANTTLPSVPILGSASPECPLDLTRAQLRGVSPYHLRYLESLKIATSCSSAVIVSGKLWGLLVCQNIEPMLLCYSARRNIESISLNFAMLISQHGLTVLKTYQDTYGQVLRETLTTQVEEGITENVGEFFTSHTGCDGLARFSGGVWSVTGEAPPESVLQRQLDCLWQDTPKGSTQSDCFSSSPMAVVDFPTDICGLSAVWHRGKDNSKSQAFFLFKNVAEQTVTWGSRQLPSRDQMGPAASFGRWREQVANHSLPWNFQTSKILLALKAAMGAMSRETDQAN